MSKDLSGANKVIAKRMNKKEGHEKAESIAKEKRESTGYIQHTPKGQGTHTKMSTSDGYMVRKDKKSAILKEAKEHGNYRREVDRRHEKEDKK